MPGFVRVDEVMDRPRPDLSIAWRGCQVGRVHLCPNGDVRSVTCSTGVAQQIRVAHLPMRKYKGRNGGASPEARRGTHAHPR